MASDAERLLMPKMILQLCLENAIKHGIAKNRVGGVVAVKVWCEEKLYIEVVNPLVVSAQPSDGL
ncbi:sensor histidine kinase, partial [Pseudoalteromonas ruthenica]|uniref:sensor histidine kinase n=1 Tax=Pseudoalteromonas ruthenica TaxID=151081 RepID=UPI003D29A82E